jgi:hypothetical protein
MNNQGYRAYGFAYAPLFCSLQLPLAKLLLYDALNLLHLKSLKE